MRPELFALPLVNISIKSYGLMMVLGFIAALLMAQRCCRKLGENPRHVSNFSLFVLLAGVAGARAMHVMHNWSEFRDNLSEVFAIWSGGLEFLGGFACALLVMLVYLKRKKLPILKFLDILAPALMLGLAFGRLGCFVNGCCFGAACDLPWAVRFPAVNTFTQTGLGCERQSYIRYNYPFAYQLRPDPQRPGEPVLQLPPDYYYGPAEPKPIYELTPQQAQDLKEGLYPMHPIHPAQLYSVLNALLLSLVLSLLFRRYQYPGQIIAAMLILYGLTRFGLEFFRIEPIELTGLTISQNLGIIAALHGLVLLLIIRRRRSPKPA